MKARIVTPVVLLAATMLGGAVVRAAASDGVSSNNVSGGTTPSYNRNTAGQTYGSALDATSPGNEPDLIKAVAADGTEGYVYAKDLQTGPDPASPAEAAARPRASLSRSLPLYANDGKSVLGVFKLTSSGGFAVEPSK